MRRSDLFALAFSGAAALTALAWTGSAAAYCRTTSCKPPGEQAHTAATCNPPQPDDCGIPLAWAAAHPCVEFSVQKDASKKVTFAQTEQVMKAAFSSWTTAACPGGGSPSILVSEGASVTCAVHEYNQTKGNANIILYHDDVWPYEGSDNTLALTTVTYDLDTGEIYDADMELNSADTAFTVGDTGVQFDLLSIVTHESGHFLGLAHSHESTATMWPVYNQHTTNLRQLSADDVAGICAIYPPGPAITGCDSTPRHGFSDQCAVNQPEPSTCSTSAPGCEAGGGRSRIPWAGAAVFGLLFAARVRLRRARRG